MAITYSKVDNYIMPIHTNDRQQPNPVIGWSTLALLLV